MADEQRIELKVTETQGIHRQCWPITRGVPLPEGALHDLNSLWMADPQGEPVATQLRILSYWPDRSIKWVLTDFQADVPAAGTAVYHLCYGGERRKSAKKPGIQLDESAEYITVCTGPLRFAVDRRRFGLFESVELGNLEENGCFAATSAVVPPGTGGEAWVRICESFSPAEDQRQIYGMGGDCLASLAHEDYQVEVEEAGPLRTVIRCAGSFEADIPMHHYAGYRPFRHIIRIYAYAGQAFVRILHTVVVACNPRQTEVEEIAVQVPAALEGPLRYRVAAVRGEEGDLAADQYLLLSQRQDNHFRLECQEGTRKKAVAEGARTEGWMAIENDQMGVGVALRSMAEEYPKALGASGGGRGIDVYLWRDPDGGRLNFRRYSEEVAWDEGEGVYADGTGTAKTSEFFISFYGTDQGQEATALLQGLLQFPHAALDSAWMARCEVTGGFAPLDPDAFPASERMMRGFMEWAERSIHLGKWYGFFDWGDVLAAWEEASNDWRFYGRWGWCNSEWDPRHGVWIHYLRTGEERYFRLGEAMTRHSMDVDTCHFHPFRPYMVGGCFRHSIDHFGDEPCASHTFLDNWMDYYYLSGDLRTAEVLREAGDFLLRYRWTEDPAYSFSLRSIANTLRGLLYVYEISGEERFKQRAEEVYEAIARGQNEDGSWHKRFQISTPDQLPDQAPYGMATEGTTLAVEMGTASPFSDREYLKLRGKDAPLNRVMPADEQKGYQTHYLMIGLELLQRMTGREDVAAVYCRAVDWFCGNNFDAEMALQQYYYGIICRHVAHAYRLKKDPRYLEVGRVVLQHLIAIQDWSDDPKRRGSVGMSHMGLSLLFFGVPYFLGALREAGLGEEG